MRMRDRWVVLLALCAACGDSGPTTAGPGEACDVQVPCSSGLVCSEGVCEQLSLPGAVVWLQSERPPDALRIIANRPADALYTDDGRFSPSPPLAEQVIPAPVSYPAGFTLLIGAGTYVVTAYVEVNGRAAIGHQQATLDASGQITVAGEPTDAVLVNLTIEAEIAGSP